MSSPREWLESRLYLGRLRELGAHKTVPVH
jgi:hypothetical protein